MRRLWGGEGCFLGTLSGNSLGKLSWKSPLEISVGNVSLETLMGKSRGHLLGNYLEISLGNLSWKPLLEMYLGNLSWKSLLEISLGSLGNISSIFSKKSFLEATLLEFSLVNLSRGNLSRKSVLGLSLLDISLGNTSCESLVKSYLGKLSWKVVGCRGENRNAEG